jgi:hypothetical protein
MSLTEKKKVVQVRHILEVIGIDVFSKKMDGHHLVRAPGSLWVAAGFLRLSSFL